MLKYRMQEISDALDALDSEELDVDAYIEALCEIRDDVESRLNAAREMQSVEKRK